MNDDVIEIRMLGGLRVVRADGEVVETRQWRTAKSRDLLRLLALEGGRPVSVTRVLDEFWPDVDHAKSLLSLRTSLSHIRSALGSPDTVVRVGTKIRLDHAWVDTVAFRRLHDQLREHARNGELSEVVRLAHESEALYVGPLHAADDASAWITLARDQLCSMRVTILTEGAAACVRLGWYNDAITFAEGALKLDPNSEGAYRSAMLAQAGTGNAHRALQVYERCRRHLAKEMGTDPSALTQSVHQRVLASSPEPVTSAALTGYLAQHPVVDEVVRRLEGQLAPIAILISGVPGSGRESVGRELVRRLSTLDSRVPVLLPAQDNRPDVGAEVTLRTRRLAGVARAVALVPLVPSEVAACRSELRELGWDCVEIQVPRLDRQSLRAVAEAAFRGRVSETLLRQLERESDMLTGLALTTLNRWVDQGRVQWTAAGLDVTTEEMPPSSAGRHPAQMLRELQETLPRVAQRLMEVAALAPEPLTEQGLGGLLEVAALDSAPPETVNAVHRLIDAKVLSMSTSGYRFTDARLRSAAAASMRPSLRQKLQDRVDAATSRVDADGGT